MKMMVSIKKLGNKQLGFQQISIWNRGMLSSGTWWLSGAYCCGSYQKIELAV